MKKKQVVPLILGFLVCAGFAYPTLREAYLLKLKYREARGKILHSGINQVTQYKEEEGEMDREQVTAYVPAFQYEFEVGGKKYTGTGYRFSSRGEEDRAWAEGIRRKFPNNSEATVYYNPDDPAWRSFLSDEMPDYPWKISAGLALLLAVIIAVLLGKLPVTGGGDRVRPEYEGFENLT